MDENRFSPRAQRALELAERSAGDLGHSYIGTEHLLLGLLQEEEGIARRVLEEQGLTESMVQKIDQQCGPRYTGDQAHPGADAPGQAGH